MVGCVLGDCDVLLVVVLRPVRIICCRARADGCVPAYQSRNQLASQSDCKYPCIESPLDHLALPRVQLRTNFRFVDILFFLTCHDMYRL